MEEDYLPRPPPFELFSRHFENLTKTLDTFAKISSELTNTTTDSQYYEPSNF